MHPPPGFLKSPALFLVLGLCGMVFINAQNQPTGNRGATDGLGDAVSTGLNYLYHQKASDHSLAQQYFQGSDVAKRQAQARDAAGERLTDSQMRTRFVRYLALEAISPGQFKADPLDVIKHAQSSLETDRNVDSSIAVFKDKIATNEIAAATDQLKAAFQADEYSPAVLGVPREFKQKVEKFAQQLNRMENMVEARDYASLDSLLLELKQLAPDFDTTKAAALVTNVKLESQTHLSKAKMAAEHGDQKTALEEYQEAAEVWPGNPDLKNQSAAYFSAQDTTSQVLTEFDRLVAENNYRALFDRQLEFAPAVSEDVTRQGQLQAALQKAQQADAALQQAAMMEQQGEVCGAWETLAAAVKELPNDVKLNSKWAELSTKAAEFASALTKAKEAEEKNQLGFSLTWYAIARNYYPPSPTANQAIERVSKAIFDKTAG